MDRKTHIKEVYSKYWLTARETIYGFSKYDRNLCTYITENTSQGAKLLEVAIGTGFPFADFLQKAGYSVHGVDIASNLVEKCLQLNPEIEAKVGDAEALDYPDGFFDCTYCFHSTWYFTDVSQAIDEMVRVTRPGGLILFDIQNMHNSEICSGYRRRRFHTTLLGRTIRYAKQIMKLISRRGTVRWSYVLYEVPIRPEKVREDLSRMRLRSDVSGWEVFVRNEEDESIEDRNDEGAFEAYPRLVFAVRK